jgi:alpha/beta superfamily hydrolase
VQVLPPEWSDNIFKQAQYMDYLSVPLFDYRNIGFSDIETQKLKRIYDWMISVDQDSDELKVQRYNFGKFFKEHDRRRGTNFVDVFPELESFYYSTLEMSL